jgi:hypothetical protein
LTFKTDDLRALIDAENGVASASRWRVILPKITGDVKPSGGTVRTQFEPKDLNLVCTAVRLPGIDVVVVDRNIGMVPQKVAVGKTVNPVSLTFYLTNKYTARKYWQEWMETIVGSGVPYTAGFLQEYGKQVKIQQMDTNGDVVYTVKLEEAYPINLSEIELNNAAATAAAEFTVTLQYTNYTAS